MSAEAVRLPAESQARFDTKQVLSIVGGHFINDVYMSFISPLLPLLIEKFTLSLTAAGTLTAISQAPAVLNPLIGQLADRHNFRTWIILAPAITATFTSALGLAPSPAVLALLLFFCGLSTAIFHAPAPAIVSHNSANQVGKGMSWFMAGGEFGYTVGPLIIVWAVSTWGLEGSYRLMFAGWAASLFLFWRFKRSTNGVAQPRTEGARTDWKSLTPLLLRIFLPLGGIILVRNFITTALIVFLPTYLTQRGAGLWLSGASVSLVEVAAVGGVLSSGPISDRIGRKTAIIATMIIPFLSMLAFLNVSGWIVIPLLIILGFVALSANPILMAVVQENFPQNRAVANGIYMALAFLMQTVATVMIGVMGDHLGLESAFFWCGAIPLVAIPIVLFLPKERKTAAS